MIFRAIHFMYPYILDSFTGKTLFQLNKYYNLNLLNELFGVIIPHGFDMGNIGLDIFSF